MSIKSLLLASFTVASMTVFTGETATAHSGGLNSSGCHAGSQPYHCHRAPSEMVRTQDGRNRLRCDLGSRSVECTGGARTLRSSGREVPVVQVQRQLIRHCAGLPSDFADGVMGSQTRTVLRIFQRAYGLTPDGVYGPNTARVLAGDRNGRCAVR
mgnify:CR=1 FL=1